MRHWKPEELSDELAERIGVDNDSKELKLIKRALSGLNIEYVQEYQFHEKRRFRLDFYASSLNLGIEYEGIVSNKSRHTTIKGYSKDCIKYNLAQIKGITVLRYTALNVERVKKDLRKIINAKDE